jgi:hypothetical protein
VQSRILQHSPSPDDLYTPNHPYLASMAQRNIKKIETLSKHYRKYKQLEYEQQHMDTFPRQSKTSQIS